MTADPWAELRPLIPEIRAAQKRVTALYEKWQALVDRNALEDLEEMRKCRDAGLCGVLIEDHSICIRPAFDGHRHSDWPLADNQSAGEK